MVGTKQASVLGPIAYYSEDGGGTWTPSTTQPPPKFSRDNILNSVTCTANGQTCIAAGNYLCLNQTIPLIYASDDAGKNWGYVTTSPLAQGSVSNVLNGIFY